MSKQMWPPSFAELNLEGDIHIHGDEIEDYSYTPGERKRYTFSGWGKAVDLGIAAITPEMFGATDNGREA